MDATTSNDLDHLPPAYALRCALSPLDGLLTGVAEPFITMDAERLKMRRWWTQARAQFGPDAREDRESRNDTRPQEPDHYLADLDRLVRNRQEWIALALRALERGGGRLLDHALTPGTAKTTTRLGRRLIQAERVLRLLPLAMRMGNGRLNKAETLLPIALYVGEMRDTLRTAIDRQENSPVPKADSKPSGPSPEDIRKWGEILGDLQRFTIEQPVQADMAGVRLRDRMHALVEAHRARRAKENPDRAPSEPAGPISGFSLWLHAHEVIARDPSQLPTFFAAWEMCLFIRLLRDPDFDPASASSGLTDMPPWDAAPHPGCQWNSRSAVLRDLERDHERGKWGLSSHVRGDAPEGVVERLMMLAETAMVRIADTSPIYPLWTALTGILTGLKLLSGSASAPKAADLEKYGLQAFEHIESARRALPAARDYLLKRIDVPGASGWAGDIARFLNRVAAEFPDDFAARLIRERADADPKAWVSDWRPGRGNFEPLKEQVQEWINALRPLIYTLPAPNASPNPPLATMPQRKAKARRARPKPQLSDKQREAYDVVEKHNGNFSAAARFLKKNVTTVRELYAQADRKLKAQRVGSRSVNATRAIPQDRRGQDQVTDRLP